jgi:hypothetical protein
MTQLNDCQITEFLYSIDNRFSNPAFLSGTIANVGTQIGTLVTYITLLSTSTDATLRAIFTSLLNSSPMYAVYNKVVALWTASPQSATMVQEIALAVTQFGLTIVNFKTSTAATVVAK